MTAVRLAGALLQQAPFIVTTYRPNAHGLMTADWPNRCPLSAPGEGHCRLTRHMLRRRKTGPQAPLDVLRCHTHDRHFTLYPPGFAPYQRKPLLDLAPDGTVPRTGDEVGGDRACYAGTLFEAALAAREGDAGARNSDRQQPNHWWSTQNRHLDRALLILGSAVTLSHKIRELVASVLSVDLLLLKERSHSVGYRRKGAAICDILEALPLSRPSLRLLLSGHIVDLWGPPHRWDFQRGVFERPFQLPGTRASP